MPRLANLAIFLTPRYERLRTCKMQLSSCESNENTKKLIRAKLNELIDRGIRERGRSDLRFGFWKIITLIPKLLQGRLRQGIVEIGISEDAIVYFLTDVFFPEPKHVRSEIMEKEIVAFFASKHDEQRNKFSFNASYEDIVGILQEALDEL